MSFKKCGGCHATKSIEDFNLNTSMPDGRQIYCMDCADMSNSETNPERMYINSVYIPKNHPLYQPGKYYVKGL